MKTGKREEKIAMALLQWNDNLNLNIKTLDDQHKKFVAMFNQLHEAMSQGRGREIMQGLLRDLRDYTVTHFGTEERYMKQWGYPSYPSHKEAHDKMLAKVRAISEKFESGQTLITVEVMNVIKDWLTHHIQGTDKLYVPFFVEHGLK